MLEHSWRTFPDWIPVFISVTVLQAGRAGRAILVMGLNGTESPLQGDPPLPHIQTSSQRSPWTGSGHGSSAPSVAVKPAVATDVVRR